MLGSLKSILTRRDAIVLPKDAAPGEREGYRVIPLRKTHNFRDLGGYAGANGRLTRWGTLYRSDHLHRLHPSAFAHFSRLGLHTLIDLRGRDEKRRAPNRLPTEHTINIVELPILDRGNDAMSGRGLRDRLMRGDVADLDGFGMMVGANRQFVTEFNPEYRALLDAVLAANGRPVLIHCTGGKDRTGFAAALLLKILGVSDKTIMADYLRSNELVLRPLQRQLRLYGALRGKTAHTVVMQFARVEIAYLNAAFAEIDAVYGSFAQYLRDGLKLTKQEINQLETTLLAPQPK